MHLSFSFLPSRIQATCPANLIVLHLTTLTISGEQNTSVGPAPSAVAHQFIHHTGTSYGPNVYVDRSVCNMNRMFSRLDIPLCFKVNNYEIPVNTIRQFLLLRNSEFMFLFSDLLCQWQQDSCRLHDADRPTSIDACGRHYEWRLSLVGYLQVNVDNGCYTHWPESECWRSACHWHDENGRRAAETHGYETQQLVSR
jgi:hypothetical protein